MTCFNTEETFWILCSLVGSLNKIPLSLAGIVIFHVPTSVPNVMSIFFGTPTTDVQFNLRSRICISWCFVHVTPFKRRLPFSL